MPPWMKEDRPGGWVTAEYVMLPASTPRRKEWPKLGHTDSRGTEIQRLISKLHGFQRARLGWSEAAVRREFVILRTTIVEAVRRRLTPEVVDPAEAFEVLGRFLEHAEEISLRGWRRFDTGRAG